MKVIFITFLISLALFANDKSIAQQSANSLANKAQGKYGSKSALQNSTSPISSGGTISTIDNSQSFDAKIANCPANDKGIKIEYLPQSNGILNLNIQQDTNSNGSYDYQFNVENIKYVCDGGVGLTNNKYYKFSFDKNNKKISWFEVAASTLSCYCILNSCGFGGFSKNLADNIAGNFIGVIGSSGVTNYQATLSEYDYASKSYYLSVSDSSSCSQASNDFGDANYYGKNINDTQNLSINDIAAKDENKTDSLYFVTKNLTQASVSSGDKDKITMNNIVDCNIIKKAVENDESQIEIKTINQCSEYVSCILEKEEICDSSGRSCTESIVNRVATGNNLKYEICESFNATHQICSNGSSFYLKNIENNTQISIETSNNSHFYIKRQYLCGKSTIEPNLNNAGNTISSVNQSSGILNYNDFDGKSAVINIGDFNNCQVKYCRVKSKETSTDVFSDNTSRNDMAGGTQRNVSQFKACSQLSNASYICPLESGETLIEDCSCEIGMSAAGEALGAISGVEEAIGDFTCSQN